MSADVRASTSKRLFVGGDWVDAESGRTFEDRDPFTGDLVAEVAAGPVRTRDERSRWRRQRRRPGRRPRPP